MFSDVRVATRPFIVGQTRTGFSVPSTVAGGKFNPLDLWLPRRNPHLLSGLVFPSGRAPGFNPYHAASSKLLASVIPGSGPSIINLLSGQAGAATVGTGSINSFLGPCWIESAAFAASVTIPSGSHLPVTFGGFVILVSTAAANLMGSAGWRFTWDGTHLTLVSNSVTNLSSLLTMSPGIPYFIAVSASATNCFYVTTNLLTGQIQSYIKGSGSGTPSSDTVFSVPGTVGLAGITGTTFGPAMMNNSFLSLSQLLQWAADPWLFWYP